jgi:hypothetical protein
MFKLAFALLISTAAAFVPLTKSLLRPVRTHRGALTTVAKMVSLDFIDGTTL